MQAYPRYIDKQGRAKDSSGESKADNSAYELIMHEKERLLSPDEPLRFIFSHSTLREGWDNPNVFQICTLNEARSEIRKRWEIGRGLRIPVNENVERVFDEAINMELSQFHEQIRVEQVSPVNELEDNHYKAILLMYVQGRSRQPNHSKIVIW
jgi:restriction endonuclease